MTKRKRNKKRKHQYQFNSTEMLTLKRPKFSNLTETDMTELETLFSKKLSYTKLPTLASSRWKEQFVSNLGGLETTSILWQDENLMRLKTDINTLKDQLSVMDIDKWHTHTTECNLAVKIIPYVRSLGVELCTQAWVKFYEIVNTFNIVPEQSFISVHLCEAPGAFIAALNHHLQRTGFCHDWEWCATTLNPYHESNSLSEMIADDRLIRFTHHKWYFGQDGSGDIRAKGHIEGLIDKVKEMERKREAKVLLVTADGSKDCQENPSEQESLLSQLHYCEMLAGCLMLADGGCLVIKIFTMFEAATVGLMYLLNILFEKVNTMKPSTSKSGNSEMYVVCTGYLASLERDVLWKMLTLVRDKSFTCFVGKDDVMEEFLQEHRHICHTYAGWQSSTIKRNLHLYDLPSTQVHHQLDGLQESAIQFYTDLTNVESAPKIRRLAPFNKEKLKSAFFNVLKYGRNPSTPVNQASSKYSSPYAGCSQHKNLKGTFHLRQNINALSFEERIGLMDFRQMSQPGSAIGSQFPIGDWEVEWWASMLETASFPRRLWNSRLCEAPLLDDYNFLLEHSQYLKIREERLDEHIRTLASLLHLVLESLTSNKQHLFLTRMQQMREHSQQQQQQHQGHPNPDFHHHQQQQQQQQHKDQHDDSHHNDQNHHHQDYDDVKTDHHHYNNQQHQQQQQQEEQQGSPQPVYLENTFSQPYQTVSSSNHNCSKPSDPHNSSSETPYSKFNSPLAQKSDSVPSSPSRYDTETLSTPKSCSSPISEKDCPEPSSPRRNDPGMQSNSGAHQERSPSLRNDPESLSVSEPDCFLSLRPQKPNPKPSSPRRFRPEPQSKCYSHLSLSPEKHYLKQSSPQRNIPHSPSRESAFFKSSSPQSKCYSHLSLSPEKHYLKQSSPRCIPGSNSPSTENESFKRSSPQSKCYSHLSFSPDARYMKQSSPQRYIPESNSPSTENESFKCSSPPRRNSVSSQLKLVWINNGSRGENNGSRGDNNGSRGENNGSRGENNGSRGENNGSRGENNGSRGENNGSRGENNGSRGENNGSRGENNGSRGDNNGSRGENNGSRGENNGSRGENNGSRGENNGSRGENNGSRGENNGSRGENNGSRGENNGSRGENNGSRGENNGSRGDNNGSRGENNGSRGDNYSQFQKSFSEYSQKQQLNNVIEESIDIKDNLDTWDALCDNRDCTVLFFLNLAQLFLGMEVEGGTKSNEGDTNGSDMSTASSTPSQLGYCEELATRKFCLDNICLVLERLPVDSNLVILSSSFLTRFQAGLLYILARQFQDIQMTSDPNIWLHQMVVCRGFKGLSSPALRHHLSDIQEKIRGDGTVVGGQVAIMEMVKFTHILNDRKYGHLNFSPRDLFQSYLLIRTSDHLSSSPSVLCHDVEYLFQSTEKILASFSNMQK